MGLQEVRLRREGIKEKKKRVERVRKSKEELWFVRELF